MGTCRVWLVGGFRDANVQPMAVDATSTTTASTTLTFTRTPLQLLRNTAAAE
jgi:hypothetical protein